MMIPDTETLRQYIKGNLIQIQDRDVLMDLFVICLKFNGYSYGKFRTAQIRYRDQQFTLFDPSQNPPTKESKDT